MNIGFAGLGRMGANMVRRLAAGGIQPVIWNRTQTVADALASETGCRAAATLAELVSALPAPRVVWLMLPAGDASEAAIREVAAHLAPGDVLVDGANAYYRDGMRRAAELAACGIRFVDGGVSGGVWGLANGYAMMLGGEADAVAQVLPAIRVLAPAPDSGWTHCGPAGSGHFVKMVHNGIEYGMMQSLAEGLALLRAKSEFGLDLAAIAESWRHGSVVRSWLLDLTADFLAADQVLEAIEPFVADSGEGRWTAVEAIEQGVPAPVMSLALMMRFASQGHDDYAARLMAMMRKGFGGHAVREDDHAH